MEWVIFAVLSHLCWAFVNIGDKYVVDRRVKNPYVYLVWLWIMSIGVAVLIPFVDFHVLPLHLMIWLAIAAFLYFFGGFPYIKAMQIEEPTRINVWWNLIPLFTLIIAWFTIGQKLSGTELVAMAFLMAGAVVASIHFSSKKKIKVSSALVLMIVSCLSFAGYISIFSYVVQFASFICAFIWLSVFMFFWCFTPFVLSRFRSEFKRELRQADWKLAMIVFSISALDHVGIFFSVWALSLGPAALVFSLEGVQVVFVFVIASLISIFAPSIIQEKIDKKNILLKLGAIMLMIVGILFLAWAR